MEKTKNIFNSKFFKMLIVVIYIFCLVLNTKINYTQIIIILRTKSFKLPVFMKKKLRNENIVIFDGWILGM